MIIRVIELAYIDKIKCVHNQLRLHNYKVAHITTCYTPVIFHDMSLG